MYGKVFAQLFDGTLHGRLEASAVFMAMIAIADEDGLVDLTLAALTNRTGWPVDFIKRGINDLEAEDPQSRTPDCDGRRIVRLRDNTDWGWAIVNYAKYREIRNGDDRKKYMRDYMRDRRSKQPVNNCKPQLAKLANAEAEAEAEGEVKEKNPPTPRGRGARRCPDSFELTPELRALSVELPPDFDIDGETAKFRDCEFAKPRTDWPAAWRTWMRKARDQRSYAKRAASAPTIRQPPTDEQMAEARADAQRKMQAQLARVMPRLTA